MRRWFELRDRLERAVESLRHVAVHVRRDGRWRLIQEVFINRDHLEKDQIRWWSIHELAAVIDGRGSWGRTAFGRTFSPSSRRH